MEAVRFFETGRAAECHFCVATLYYGTIIKRRNVYIYVLNLVAASLRGGMQYLRGEHTRGSEEETMIASQIEVIGQQSLLF